MTRERSLGAAVLAAHRRQLNLSQEQLALRAGLSVRAVRDLEAGRTERPRLSTIALLCSALELDGVSSERLREAWTRRRRLSSYEQVFSGRLDFAALKAMSADMNSETQDAAIFTEAEIDDTGRMTCNEMRVVMRARCDGAQHRTLYWVRQPEIDTALLELEVVAGGRISHHIRFPDGEGAAFEIEFDQSLRRGELATLALRVDTGKAVRPTTRPANTFYQCLTHATDLLSLDLRFAVVPETLASYERPANGTHANSALVPRPTCQAVYRDVGPGVYGFRWQI